MYNMFLMNRIVSACQQIAPFLGVSFNGISSCFASILAHSTSMSAGQRQAATCNAVTSLLPIASCYLTLLDCIYDASTSINSFPLRNLGKAVLGKHTCYTYFDQFHPPLMVNPAWFKIAVLKLV